MYKKIAYLAISQVAIYAAPFILIPFIARTVPIEMYGRFVLILTITQLALIISDYGQYVSGVKRLARSNTIKIKSIEVTRQISAKMFITLPMAIVISIIAAICAMEKISILELIGLSIGVAVQAFMPTWIYVATGQQKKYLKIVIMGRLLYVIIGFLIIKADDNIFELMLPIIIANLITTAILLGELYEQGYRLNNIRISTALKITKNDSEIFMSRLFTSILNFIPIILMVYINPVGGAIYGVADQLFKAGQGLISTVTQTALPTFAKSQKIRDYYKALFIFGCVILIAVIFGQYLAGYIILNLYGVAYIESVLILKVLLIGLIANFFNSMLGYPATNFGVNIKYINMTTYIVVFVWLLGLLSLNSIVKISPFIIATSVVIAELSILFLRLILWLRLRSKNA